MSFQPFIQSKQFAKPTMSIFKNLFKSIQTITFNSTLNIEVFCLKEIESVRFTCTQPLGEYKQRLLADRKRSSLPVLFTQPPWRFDKKVTVSFVIILLFL